MMEQFLFCSNRFANSDMVFFSDLMEAMEVVDAKHEDFLLVGRRRDLDFSSFINFEDPVSLAEFKVFCLD